MFHAEARRRREAEEGNRETRKDTNDTKRRKGDRGERGGERRQDRCSGVVGDSFVFAGLVFLGAFGGGIRRSAGIVRKQCRQREIIEIQNHLFRKRKAQVAFSRSQLRLAADVVQLRGISFQII